MSKDTAVVRKGGLLKVRMLQGFFCGVLATVAMTIVHLSIWTVTGRLSVVAVTSKMLPEIIVAKILGPRLPTFLHVLLAAVAHFGYGGFWGAVLFALTPRVTIWKGIAMGAFLYVVMQSVLFPAMGRGFFGGATPGRDAVLAFLSIATHLTYGTTLGWLGGREVPSGLGRAALSSR